jgi:NAD-dependent SIR2 family protein deacetylase
MTTTKHLECNDCEAVFRIKHDMDDHYYKITHCPFCGSELDDESYDIDEE